MRGIIAIAGMLMAAVGCFLLLSDLISLQAGCGAALLVIGAALFADTLTGNAKVKG